MKFDTLEDFRDWWLRTRKFRPPVDPLRTYPNATTVVLYRRGQYQVQMVNIAPNTTIREHDHPNIDSYEVTIGGCGDICIWGKTANTLDKTLPRIVSLPSGCPHGGRTGPEGGTFLSIQKWRNGVAPTCVGVDSGDNTSAFDWIAS